MYFGDVRGDSRFYFQTTQYIDGEDIDINPAEARYIKINCIKRATEWGNSIFEIVIKETGGGTGRTARASSEQDNTFQAHNAIDGNMTTRWASTYDDGQWLEIDLGKKQDIYGFEISWEEAYAKEYEIMISDDKNRWERVYSTKESDGDLDKIEFTKKTAQYIKINCVKRATEWGVSIYEIIIKDKIYHFVKPEVTADASEMLKNSKGFYNLRDPQIERKVRNLLERMTLQEKIGQLIQKHGSPGAYNELSSEVRKGNISSLFNS